MKSFRSAMTAFTFGAAIILTAYVVPAVPAVPAAAATGDMAISLTLPGIDPAVMQNEITSFLGTLAPTSTTLSPQIGNALYTYDALVAIGTPANPGETWPGCGACTLSLSYTGSGDQAVDTLTVTIPAADVKVNLPGWLAQIIAGIIGTLAGLLMAALCAAAFAPGVTLGPLICGPVFAFFVGFVWSLMGQFLTGGSLTAAKTYATALITGVISLAGAAAVGGVIGWGSATLRTNIISVTTAVGNFIRGIPGWIGNKLANGWATFAGAMQAIGAAFDDALYPYVSRLPGFFEAIAPNSLRVLPFGDSITYGYGSSDGSGYRCDLQNYLSKLRLNYQFVGSLSAGTACAQADNEGHSGWTIGQLAGIEKCTITGYEPNVVLLDIGTNDINNGGAVGPAVSGIESLIGSIFTDDPGVTVLVSSLIPTPNSTVANNMQSFNQQVSAWADQQQSGGRRVAWMDQGAVQTPNDLADGLHPNDTGYQKMATTWNIGIDQALDQSWVQQPNPQGAGCAPPPPASPSAPPAPAWQPWGQVASGVGGVSPPSWQPMGEIATGVGAPGSQIQFAPVFGSGRADYLDVQPDSSVLAWENTGAGSGGAPVWVPKGVIATGVGAPGSQIQFADMTGDGRADYLDVNPDSSVLMWENAGLGSNGLPVWIPQGVIASGTSVPGNQIHFADLNGDGRADYLDIRPDSSVVAYENPGLSNLHGGVGWIPLGVIASGVGAPGSQIQFAPVFGTNRADYLDVQPDSSVIAYYNPGLSNIHNGDGWIPMGEIATGVGAPGSQIQFADLTGSGRADYLNVQSDSSVLAWYNNPGPALDGQIQFGHVFGTGRADYLDVLPDSSVNAWYNAGGSGGKVTWVGPITVATGVGAPGNEIRFADITGSGRADYLWVHPDSSVSMWDNAGPGSGGALVWLPVGTIATGVGAPGNEIQFADITGTGRADYLWVHPDSSVTMWENPGIGAVNPNGIRWNGPQDLASGVGAPGDQIKFADLTGDGRADYLWVHGDSSVTAWYNPGLSNINTSNGFGWVPWGEIATGVGAPGSEIQFADLTGNGKADYLWVHPDSSVDMWYNP
jgi:lysophospholipase L1-like esterase